jgi:hypothetical protein
MVRDMCDVLRRSEKEWSSEHFAERKGPRWLILERLLSIPPSSLDELPSFLAVRPVLAAHWRRWLIESKEQGLPPAALVSQPAMPAAMLAVSALNKPGVAFRRFVREMSSRPPDTQILLWLHMLAPRPESAPTKSSTGFIAAHDTEGLISHTKPQRPPDASLTGQTKSASKPETPPTTCQSAPETKSALTTGQPAPETKSALWMTSKMGDSSDTTTVGALERLLWNAVTVIQNSPLPFAQKARSTLLTYQNLLPIPIPKSASPTAPSSGPSLSDLNELAARGGIGDDWMRSLWESVAFPSTPPFIAAELRSHLLRISAKAPESEKVYDLLASLDAQNKTQGPFQDSAALLATLLHLSNTLATLDPRPVHHAPIDAPPGHVNPTIAALLNVLMPVIAAKLSGQNSTTFQAALIRIAHILHLHSLMTLAQIRRAVALFWTLAYALSLRF